MKRKYCLIVICAFFLLPFIVKAQVPYLGGNGNGFVIISALSFNLSITDSLYNGCDGDGSDTKKLLNASLSIADSLYNGGIGDGYSFDKLLNASLGIADSLYNGGDGNGFSTDTLLNGDISVADSLYNGGIGDGYSFDKLLNASLSIEDSLYNGGNGNGFHTIIVTNVILYSLDSLYNGGIGRGEIQLISPNINLGICSDSLRWNGNISIAWGNPANWDCGTVPGINSIVIIPSAAVRYPTVFSSTEIRRLRLLNGASVTVQTGVILTLNGQ